MNSCNLCLVQVCSMPQKQLPDEKVLERLKEPDFNPLEGVILSEELLSPDSSSVVNALGSGAARPVSAANILSYESQRVRIETQTSAPAILVLNDANYPGWRAFVNGQPAPILTADYLFRGVIVPSGHARVEFVYAPTSFRLGAAISLASLIVLALPLIGLAIPRQLGTRGTGASMCDASSAYFTVRGESQNECSR